MWTVLNHNSTDPVRVQGSSLHKPHIMKFDYGASAKQLQAIIAQSQQCQQEVVYNCRKSRLFNMKGEYLIFLGQNSHETQSSYQFATVYK